MNEDVRQMEETPPNKNHQNDSKAGSWKEKLTFMKFGKDKEKKTTETYDPTTWKGFFQDLLQHIKKSDVTPLARNSLSFSYYLFSHCLSL